MSSSEGGQRGRRGVAAAVTVSAVLVLWAFASMRHEEQAAALSRQWVGEQWDVVRQCFVGTPIARGEGAATIATKLEARLLETLITASEADVAPDPHALWPARCVPRLAELRSDPAILEGDASDALGTLEVLAPRVIAVAPEGPGSFALGEAATYVDALAMSIAALDEALPPGALYDATLFEVHPPSAPPTDVIASVACASAAPVRRPFFPELFDEAGSSFGEATLFDELETEHRSLRLAGDRGGFTLATASMRGTDMRTLTPHGTSPRFWDAETLLWLRNAALVRAPVDGPPEPPIPLGVRADAMAICRAHEVGHLLLRTAEGAKWIRLLGDAADDPIRVTPAPPDVGVVVACSRSTIALAWPRDGEWSGALCAEGSCEALPTILAGGDLQLGVRGDAVIAVARGRRTDVRMARRLERQRGGWSAPTPVLRGTLRVASGAFVVQACDGMTHTSRDGAVWVRRTSH